MGLVEPLKEIPRLLRLRRMLIDRWAAAPPDVFVGIDAPDFNLGLELKLKRHGIRTVHYVSPTVWAWRQGRVHKIGRAADKVLCLFPFEKKFYDEHGVSAEFVGHRMADSLAPVAHTEAAREKLGIDAETVVAVLPGSRVGEVSRLGSEFASACALLHAELPQVRFVAPMAGAAVREIFSEQLAAAEIAGAFTVIDADAPTAIAASDVVLIASGTATLQAALIGRAMVVAYRLAPATYQIAKLLRLVKSRFISLPNLLADEALVPEFIQDEASPQVLCDALLQMLTDEQRRKSIQERLATLQQQLALGADDRAARAVLKIASVQ
jgi:lipid-A-disaccharide synthase